MHNAVFKLGTMHYHELLHIDENYLNRSMNIRAHQKNLEHATTAREGLRHADALIQSEFEAAKFLRDQIIKVDGLTEVRDCFVNGCGITRLFHVP